MAKIDNETTKSVADLIKIHIAVEQIPLYSENLNTAIDAVNTFSELNTKDVPITSQTVGTENIMRDDVVEDGLSQEDALSNAHQTKNGYFLVKKVFND